MKENMNAGASGFCLGELIFFVDMYSLMDEPTYESAA